MTQPVCWQLYNSHSWCKVYQTDKKKGFPAHLELIVSIFGAFVEGPVITEAANVVHSIEALNAVWDSVHLKDGHTVWYWRYCVDLKVWAEGGQRSNWGLWVTNRQRSRQRYPSTICLYAFMNISHGLTFSCSWRIHCASHCRMASSGWLGCCIAMAWGNSPSILCWKASNLS